MYSLLIWTAVAGTQFSVWNDWRPLVTDITRSIDGTTPRDNCERIASELGLKQGKYRCVKVQ
jgi:hypothetical protein